jgi:serine kinase of HPr protein (carbohydrate metabolism regulator)
MGPRSARNMMARQNQQLRGTTEEVKTIVVIESEVRK